MFTKRAPFPSAAASTLRCSGGKSSAQRWYSGFSVWYTDAAPCAARVANAASVSIARRHVDLAQRLRVAAERRSTAPVDDAHGESAAHECDGGGAADGTGAEDDVHVAGHAGPFAVARAESSTWKERPGTPVGSIRAAGWIIGNPVVSLVTLYTVQ